MEVKCNAVVLRSADYKDNDKILTLFSLEHGKLTAGAKGVRKAGAKLKFATQPFCFAEFVLAEKGGRYTVTSAEQIDGFYPVREDIVKFYCASTVVETVNTLLPEGVVAEALFKKTVLTLAKIGEKDELSALIDFLLFALENAGYSIDLTGCLSCGKTIGERGYFSFTKGGFFCEEHVEEEGQRASGITFATLKAVKENRLPPEGDGKKRALRLLKEYILEKTEVRLECLSELIRLI